MPAPLDPGAPNQTPGAGGVIDDQNACDNLPRFMAGADSYTIVGDQGSPARGNGVTILPGADSTGTGAFRDV
jgi:hypothetical protein